MIETAQSTWQPWVPSPQEQTLTLLAKNLLIGAHKFELLGSMRLNLVFVCLFMFSFSYSELPSVVRDAILAVRKPGDSSCYRELKIDCEVTHASMATRPSPLRTLKNSDLMFECINRTTKKGE